MAQGRRRKGFVWRLSHLVPAQPQKTQQKYCHCNPFLTFTQIPVGGQGGRRGTGTWVGLAAMLNPTFWGERGESP